MTTQSAELIRSGQHLGVVQLEGGIVDRIEELLLPIGVPLRGIDQEFLVDRLGALGRGLGHPDLLCVVLVIRPENTHGIRGWQTA